MPPVRYCSACGAELPSRPPVTCAECGTNHWRNPWPGANGIVVRGGHVLLGRRAHDPWRDMWCSPGGFCELGEHPTETVVREVLEETGLRCRIGRRLPDATYTDARGREKIVRYWSMHPRGGEFEPSDEVDEVRWLTLEEARRLLTYDHDRAVLDALEGSAGG